ncbi:MAG: glycosyltransferase family 4 protein [Bacteroidales bacterium]|nr:glycosyltransferase family 4 protein [Bacteroidales bacterium]
MQILFIRFRPYPAVGNGGDSCSQRNLNVLYELFGKGNVEIFDIYPDTREESKWQKIRGLRRLFYGYFFGLTRKKLEKIETLSHTKQLVFIERSTFGCIAKHLKKQGFSGTVVTFFQNVEKRFYEDYISKYNPFKKNIVNCAAKNEADAMKYSDWVVALNKRDNALLQHYYHRNADALIPISLVDKKPQETFEKIRSTPVGLFVGSYMPMNVGGILWFVENVLPHVEMQLQIVGKGMGKLGSKLKQIPHYVRDDNTKVWIFSDVEDISPFYEQCDFIVSPIFKGSGMKVKTCEALMYGKHIFGTKEAFEGYDLEPQKIGACCENAEEFITAIKQFTQTQPNRFNSFSRMVYLEKHQPFAAKNIMASLLEKYSEKQ